MLRATGAFLVGRGTSEDWGTEATSAILGGTALTLRSTGYELLHPLAGDFGDIDRAVPVHADRVRQAELPRSLAFLAETAECFTVEIQCLRPVRSAVRDQQVPIGHEK